MRLNFKKSISYLLSIIKYGFYKKKQNSYSNDCNSNSIVCFRKSGDYSTLKMV